MDRREKSREQWQRELAEDQHNVVPADGSRVGHILAKRSSQPAPIADLAHLARALMGGVLVAIAISILSSNIAHKGWLALAVFVIGCCIGATGFRWRPKIE